jgi:hypothetical protein
MIFFNKIIDSKSTRQLNNSYPQQGLTLAGCDIAIPIVSWQRNTKKQCNCNQVAAMGAGHVNRKPKT